MLKGNIALVTGASRGIGAAVARLLGANHARVAVNDHARADLADAVLFYCLDWARCITGTYLPVCGGSRMG